MRTPLVLLPVLALGLLSACGDDDDSSSTTVAAVSTDASGGSTAETSATDETTVDDSLVDATTPASGSVNPEFADWCAKSEEISAATGATSNVPAELEAQWPETRELIDEIVELSPDEIADDMALLQEYWDNIGEVLEANDWDPNAISDEEVTPEGFDEAGQNIQAFDLANCGGG